MLQSGSRRGNLELAYLWLIILDEATPLKRCTQMMYKMYWPMTVKLPALPMYVMEQLEKGARILQTISVAEYHEPA